MRASRNLLGGWGNRPSSETALETAAKLHREVEQLRLLDQYLGVCQRRRVKLRVAPDRPIASAGTYSCATGYEASTRKTCLYQSVNKMDHRHLFPLPRQRSKPGRMF